MSVVKIKQAPDLWGIRHWAAWNQYLTPRYQVYRYHGTDGSRYYFSHIKTKATIAFTFPQLRDNILKNVFKGFCLDHKKMVKFLEEPKK